MVDRRRILGVFAIFSLVVLRLVIGWHFFGEGTKKLKYDRHDGQLQLDFSAEGFLNEAKGPLAGLYHGHAPNTHAWRELLAVPRQNSPVTEAEVAERSQWIAEYEARRDEAKKKGDPEPVEFSKFEPYRDWANRIADDWRRTLERVKSVPGLSDEQKRKADETLQSYLTQLSNYLAGEQEAIVAYQHELWRLANWRKEPEAANVPFYQQRIAAKTSETSAQAAGWVNQVRAFDSQYALALNDLLTSEQRNDPATSKAMAGAVTEPGMHRLSFINHLVTWITIGVGACLLLGFFTRLASLVGAVFLLSVIASQPFWLPEAHETIHQCVEFAGLLVLAGTGAGRWLGLDFLTYAMFNRRKGVEPVRK